MTVGASPTALVEPVLAERGIEHGFGQRGSNAPADCIFPRQVHGTAVARVDADGVASPAEADAILAVGPGVSVGVVTADCVPILLASDDGRVVGAIHAGWRGFAAGVIQAGVSAIRAQAGERALVAAIGPAARGCCYEVDRPVRQALGERHAAWLDEAMTPGRSEHWQLDLPRLAERVLAENGLISTHIGTIHRVCTICNGDRFESYRRDGAGAGRLRHFIQSAATIPRQG